MSKYQSDCADLKKPYENEHIGAENVSAIMSTGPEDLGSTPTTHMVAHSHV